MGVVVRLNWCHTCGGGRNFGDQLGPVLLRHYGLNVIWSRPQHATMVAVGSILSKVPNGWRGTVLGTGFIQQGMRKDLRRAKVLAVRGELTRAACELPAQTALGDLGMLVPDLYRGDAPRVGTLVVPHVVDDQIAARHAGADVAPVTWGISRILSTIAAADVVYTSSLHALIAADAFGVPHVLEPHPLVRGGLFKFHDYASSLGESIVPGVERLTPRRKMHAKQQELRAIVRGLA